MCLKMKEFRTAIVLCGGRGTRLGQLGKKIPKTLVKIQGKPILWFILKSLKKNKFNHVILPVGFKGKKIKRYLKNNIFNLNLDVINTGINTSIAKRIFKIKKYIKSNHFLLLNGDAIFNANLIEIFNNHKKNKQDISFICSEAEADFGTVGTINNRIVNFERGLDFNSVNTNKKNFKAYVYSGMSIINKKILEQNFKHYNNFEKEFFPRVIKKYKAGIKILKGFWYAMDNVKDLDNLNKKNTNNKIFFKINKLKKYFYDK